MTTPDSARLNRVVGAVLGIPESEAAEASSDRIPQWDSIAHLNLLLAVEQEFGIRFDADAISRLDSVARLREALDECERSSSAR